MNHLIVSREYPPSIYPQGGIGTYVEHIARLLAERGETVHVIGQRWAGAPIAREIRLGGRLVIHRVTVEEPLRLKTRPNRSDDRMTLTAMLESAFPAQGFGWQASLLAESLVDEAAIDLIEGQDYEAPLYYFLLRRALGLGPSRCPPCLVHLHSPTEFICHYNGWSVGRPDYLTMKRLEDYVIRSADALICPSWYLARQAESHYGLEPGSVEQVPLPVGDTPFIERTTETWRRGTICYVGRMEPRKGLFEWLEAAASVATGHPDLKFELIGSDTPLTGHGGPSVRESAQKQLSDRVKASFTFREAEPRQQLWKRLAHARLAVVPSRWENFPNTCVEAMCGGLPVLASPSGGMAEMIEDGRTGWLARSGRPDDLSYALRRALDTAPAVLENMGRAASEAIRRKCDNTAILDRHLELRYRLSRHAAHRSLRLPLAPPPWQPPAPPSPPIPRSPAVDTQSRPVDPGAGPLSSAAGIGLVIVDDERGSLQECLASVRAQTRPPAAVIICAREPLDAAGSRGHEIDIDPAWRVHVRPDVPARTARAKGLRALLEHSEDLLGVAVVDSCCRLEPEFIERCTSVLVRNERVGLVSSWSGRGSDGSVIDIRPAPELPYQWILNDVSPAYVARTVALRQAVCVDGAVDAELSNCDPELAVLADGWLGVTYPAVLSRRIDPAVDEDAIAALSSIRLRPLLMAQSCEPANAALLLEILEARTGLPASTNQAPRAPHQDQLDRLRRMLRRLLLATWQLGARARLVMARAMRRSGDPVG